MSNTIPRVYPTPRRLDFNGNSRTPQYDGNPLLNMSSRSQKLSKSTSNVIELIIIAAEEAATAAQASAEAFSALAIAAGDALALKRYVGGTRKRSKKMRKRTRKN